MTTKDRWNFHTRRRYADRVSVIRQGHRRWEHNGYPLDNSDFGKGGWFFPTLRAWFADRRDPTCGVCLKRVDGDYPLAFLLLEADTAPSSRPPRQVRFVDLCNDCSAQSDIELWKTGFGLLQDNAAGSVFTFDDGHRWGSPVKAEGGGRSPTRQGPGDKS